VIDDGLGIIRRLWEAGLAHRDIKPANLLVRDGRLLLIDVAFVEIRPSPWRQAVDLANMMLCLALRSSPEQVYQRRALRQFSVEEISEGFSAARGLALPSQLRRMLKEQGRDVHGQFLQLLPQRPRPIRIQRWSARRIGLLLLVVPLAVLLVPTVRVVLLNHDPNTTRLQIIKLDCDDLEPLWLQAQAVPSASLVPCVELLPGWSVLGANARKGWSEFTLNHDQAGDRAVVVRLTRPATRPGPSRYRRSGQGCGTTSRLSGAPTGSPPPGTTSSQVAASPPGCGQPPTPRAGSPLRHRSSSGSPLAKPSNTPWRSVPTDACTSTRQDPPSRGRAF
jgi:hypothetical protein